MIKDQIEKLIGQLDAERDKILSLYLEALEDYEGGVAADCAGKLHDIDRHITNLHSELKRVKARIIVDDTYPIEEESCQK